MPWRRECLGWLAGAGSLAGRKAALPLPRDPRARVRLTAMVVVCVPKGAEAASPEPVALLMERVRLDESIKVRRLALGILGAYYASPQFEGFFEQLLAEEQDPKLHKAAGIGLSLCRQVAEEQEANRC